MSRTTFLVLNLALGFYNAGTIRTLLINANACVLLLWTLGSRC